MYPLLLTTLFEPMPEYYHGAFPMYIVNIQKMPEEILHTFGSNLLLV